MSTPNISEIHSNDIDFANRIIYLHGSDPIDGEEPGVDYRMSSKFIKNMNLLTLSSSDPIYVHMNTVGGEWSYGMAIYDAIKTSPCDVTIVAYSWARSMSSIILQAANKRVMKPYSCFMVHWGTYSDSGHYLTVKSGMEFTEKTERMMLDIYANKCVDGPFFKNKNMSVSEVSDFIENKILEKSDWWLTAEEAIDYGFADCIA